MKLHSYSLLQPLRLLAIILMIPLLSSCYYMMDKEDDSPKQYVLAIHGGAGFSNPDMPEEDQQAYKDKMKEALAAGEAVLAADGSAVDAVETAIRIMEDSPLFNAGKGAVYTAEGTNSLDASIMDGSDRQAGAVAGVSKVKNPISAARKVMTDSKHVMLSGAGADLFARDMGLEIVDSSWFRTEKSWNAYLRRKAESEKMGTVGAVARDRKGNLAAGTSTGGMMMKEYGRIGDSPVIGAGTWADNNTCAISCTGHGEFFIRYGAAHEVAARVEHRKWTMERSANFVINKLFKSIEANGGMIGVDMFGNVTMPFNTTSMFRGYVKENEAPVVKLFAEEYVLGD